MTTKYTGVVENKSGIILSTESLLFDARFIPPPSISAPKPRAASAANTSQGKLVPTDRKADWFVRDQTTKEGTGAHPKIRLGPGFGGVFLHGLDLQLRRARHHQRHRWGDPRSLRFFGVRFTGPVKFGDALQTEAWEVGAGPKGTGVCDAQFYEREGGARDEGLDLGARRMEKWRKMSSIRQSGVYPETLSVHRV
ncbi:hypothetical protein B0H16DRAFT_1726174 [Mycena metata]|uniref:Uncharacterized protein n=1 Tax=Mycena metata TaxID=1033252 RepID=A0AAD7IQZ9_9AGAR|nr:hypothetical protein B0H16DRAFT_1726174 [Mycena metata]